MAHLVISLIAGLICGLAAGWFAARFRYFKPDGVSAEDFSRMSSDKLLAEQRLEDTKAQLAQLNMDLKVAAEKQAALLTDLATVKTQNENLNLKLTDQKKEIQDLHEKIKEQFENIASKIVFDNSQRIQQQHAEKLTDLLTPFRERIIGFEKKVQEANEQNIRDNQSLKEQIRNLQEINKTIGEEAKNLTTALKGQVKTQGNWGEMILESVLERSGLVRDREYVVQSSITTEEGRRLQPDVVVKLPEGKNIVIDSKVSLIAYERYSSAADDASREAAAREHLVSLRRHIKGLGEKNYQQLYGVNSLDFVLLFIPVEPAFSLAINQDPGIFNDAFDNNIVIVSTSTLLAVLRTISSIWKLEHQNQNAREIARQSGALYDKFVGLVTDLEGVGKKIGDAHSGWEDAMKKLHTGRGNLVGAVERIRKLGADSTKSIPSKYLNDESGEQDVSGNPPA